MGEWYPWQPWQLSHYEFKWFHDISSYYILIFYEYLLSFVTYNFHRYTGTQPMTQTVWRQNGRRSPPLVLGNQTVGRPSFLGTITWVTGSEVSLWSTTGQCPTLCMRTVSWESGGWLTCVMFFIVCRSALHWFICIYLISMLENLYLRIWKSMGMGVSFWFCQGKYLFINII